MPEKVSMRKFIKIPHLAEAVGCTIPLSGRAKRKSRFKLV
jgi:hypothetical protein